MHKLLVNDRTKIKIMQKRHKQELEAVLNGEKYISKGQSDATADALMMR